MTTLTNNSTSALAGRAARAPTSHNKGGEQTPPQLAATQDSASVPAVLEPHFEERAGRATALLSSLVLHIALLLFLALCVFTPGKNSEGIVLNADSGKSQDTALEELQTFALEIEALDETVEAADIDVQLDVPIEPLVATPQKLNAGSLAAASFASTTVDDVIQQLTPKGDGRGASFFGAYAEGKRFVYVLDSSRSMLGDRWVYACTQLLDSLNGLTEEQEFYIICFDWDTTFLFNTPPQMARYYPADNETIGKVQAWLKTRILGRATMPATALTYAMKFNPDAIFLLSDGELQDNSLQMLRRTNSRFSEDRQIPIHTIHLFSAQGRRTLQAIANENQGTFTPIEGNKPFGQFRRR